MLWQLFLSFLLIGFVSFGGGYAMIPVIEREVTQHGWMTTQGFTDVVAVAGMSPGPIATNSSIVLGYHNAGVLGAAVSALGTVIPSFLITYIGAVFFYRVQENQLVKSALYGVRPVVTALIIYAAIRFGISNGLISSLSWHTVVLYLIFAMSLTALIKFKIHPLFVIILSGVLGITFFS